MAATRTDEAVTLLWSDFLGRPDPQVVFAVAGLDEGRLRPLALARFAECRDSAVKIECNSLFHLLEAFAQQPPKWIVDAFADLARNARREELRQAAVAQLVRLGHPAGREPLQRQLAALSAEGEARNGWRARQLIRDVARYGADSRESGPDIERYLDPRFDGAVRSDAALALGRIDARDGGPGARRACARVRGRLGAGLQRGRKPRPAAGDRGARAGPANRRDALASRRAQQRPAGSERHRWRRLCRPWHERGGSALSRLARRPGSPTVLRWAPALDWRRRGPVLRCARAATARRRGRRRTAAISGLPAPVVLRFEPPGAASQAAIRERFSATEVRGRVVAIRPLPSGELVALNAGEFGGGVLYRPRVRGAGDARARARRCDVADGRAPLRPRRALPTWAPITATST
jgi:hypothetical protein